MRPSAAASREAGIIHAGRPLALLQFLSLEVPFYSLLFAIVDLSPHSLPHVRKLFRQTYISDVYFFRPGRLLEFLTSLTNTSTAYFRRSSLAASWRPRLFLSPARGHRP